MRNYLEKVGLCLPGTTMCGRFRRDESGATAVEYGLITALVAVGMLGALAGLGGNVQGAYQYIVASYQAAT